MREPVQTQTEDLADSRWATSVLPATGTLVIPQSPVFRLEARKDANGRWLISKESLERWNRQRVRRTPQPEQRVVGRAGRPSS